MNKESLLKGVVCAGAVCAVGALILRRSNVPPKSSTTSIKDIDPAEAKNNLSQEEAEARSKLVSNVHYTLDLALQKGKEDYHGELTVTFAFHGSAKDCLFFDFVGKEITCFEVNGRAVSSSSGCFRANRLYLPCSSLTTSAQNTVVVCYTNNYDHTGAGFHQFIDPADSNEYVYTNFEPFECHRMLPCFDQPDIRSTLELTVTADPTWRVIANGMWVQQQRHVDEQTQRSTAITHRFRRTPPIPTYLFALVAGPYCCFEDHYDNGRVPLGLYCRKSMAPFLDTENLFTLTKQGLAYYEDFFAVPYPFDKYDQLFVPEFNEGAMENVGCVTFTEHYLHRETPTFSQLANRADTVLHEMAHMWFGNLVSPVWWDGLWLNESFATYMAALCTAEATQFGQTSWLNFSSGMKEWAFREDQLTSTHPIQAAVADTDQTFLNFDGITYGKGSALLKQLVFVVGMEGFRAGMRWYFDKHAWSNTTIGQFLEALEQGGALASSGGSRLDSSQWAQEFLQTAGCNRVSLQAGCDQAGTRFTSVSIVQTACSEQHPHLRKHHLEVGMFDWDSQQQQPVARCLTHVELEADGLTNCSDRYPALLASPVPDFVFLNCGDHAFVQSELDPKSLQFALAHLHQFPDALMRQQLWGILWGMMRDQASLKCSAYLTLIIQSIGFETNPKLVEAVARRANSALAFYCVPELHASLADRLFDALFSLLQNSTTEEWGVVYARATVGAARTRSKVEQLLRAVATGSPVGTFTLPQDLQWSVAIKATAWGLPGAEEQVARLKKEDPTDRGDRSARTAATSAPSQAVKEGAWALFMDSQQQSLSSHQMEATMEGFLWGHVPEQAALTKPFETKFFEVIRGVFQKRKKEFAMQLWHNLCPSDPDNPDVLQSLLQLKDSLLPTEKVLERNVNDAIDDYKRIAKARAFERKK